MKTLIVAINAKAVHKALSPWCLKAYAEKQGMCGDSNIEVLECDINEPINEILARIFSIKPIVLAFSCYIWNIEVVKKIAPLLKNLLGNVKIVLGGPEMNGVGHGEMIDDYSFADYIIVGQGESAFYELLCDLYAKKPLKSRVMSGEYKELCVLPSPFTSDYFASFSYEKIPIEKRLIYYESTRGCPFSCSYCTSSIIKGLECVSIKRVKQEVELLLRYGVTTIKFIDRTFNAENKRAENILEFVGGLDAKCVFHFEVAPELFSQGLLDIIEKLPYGRVQFELGLQSVNGKTLKAINRKQNVDKAIKNIKRLVGFGNCHIHIGLIAGLPYDNINDIKTAINLSVETGVHCLQLGFLKMLKGTPILDLDFGAVYGNFAPYEVMQTNTLSFGEIIKLKQIEAIIDRFYNSGGFVETIKFACKEIFNNSAYVFFDKFSEYLKSKNIKTNASLEVCYEALCEFLIKNGGEAMAVHHYIKMDCFTFDRAGLALPKNIENNRQINAEKECRITHNIPQNIQIRAEYFELDKSTQIFVYDNKDDITNRYKAI
ncbi:MAG: B12-binding domain-containing radical SAM protein [Firmicutes bacterium]|nr:B12-binding domain-containing radical SAM protein [Bacillota bacterium]